jgi:hypothetical protein
MKRSALLLLLLCIGCARKPNKINITISLTDSNHSLKIVGFDRLVIADIGRDSVSEAWQSFLPVYRMPADTDLKDYQKAQPGNYKIKDSIVVFTPDTPFRKEQAYFLRYYQYDKDADLWHQIKEKKRIGSLSYIDLIIKY